MSTLLSILQGASKPSRRYTIETRELGADPAWKGWKVTRRYATARSRDLALEQLQVIPGWEHRVGSTK